MFLETVGHYIFKNDAQVKKKKLLKGDFASQKILNMDLKALQSRQGNQYSPLHWQLQMAEILNHGK